MKNKTILYIKIIVVCIAIIAFCLFYYNVTNPKNVFEEIYDSWKYRYLSRASIENVPALEDNSYDFAKFDGVVFDYISLFYDESYIKEECFISIYIKPKEKTLKINNTITYSDFDKVDNIWAKLSISYEYNTETKVLQMNPIDAGTEIMSLRYPDKYEKYETSTEQEYLYEFFELHGVTKEDLDEYKDYILNEVIIGSWVEGNKGKTRFSSEDPGDFIVIDNSYQNLGEEWQGEGH